MTTFDLGLRRFNDSLVTQTASLYFGSARRVRHVIDRAKKRFQAGYPGMACAGRFMSDYIMSDLQKSYVQISEHRWSRMFKFPNMRIFSPLAKIL